MLGANGNTALPFKVIIVHDAFDDAGIVPEDMGSAKYAVNECCLPMINMRDNRYVSNFINWFHPVLDSVKGRGNSGPAVFYGSPVHIPQCF
ncbi:MAG: hypothetical protein BWY09_03103 [Candidatus Hydrogenedentes bacterium ADurb.Bin179]|nr:MAG: hypothetical protein BWY09_03103 [Candidatus Hydrogenedentes bacterium ADurb.Bin179]